MIDIKRILSSCDHTLLRQDARAAEIDALCAEALEYQTASVCVSPCQVKRAAGFLKGRIRVCTVVGFPNGTSTSEAKLYETRQAIADGADEIDMVINIGRLKDGDEDYVREEIRALKQECKDRVLKVIVETCLLSRDEKIAMCRIVGEAGADYIKTSTGFAQGGATFEDVELFAAHVPTGVKIKAAGGINSLEDAQRFLDLGADRLGTSRIIGLVKKI